uniref:Uncharacterized protein n=2 Tax=Oryza TaxID=4527 RepID=Q7XIW1_ORYSJ|nr:hypothetical protein [Oryza sativa Japonica Group]
MRGSRRRARLSSSSLDLRVREAKATREPVPFEKEREARGRQSADAGGPQVPLPSDAGRRTLRSMPRLPLARLRTVASASAFVSSKMASCVGALLASKVKAPRRDWFNLSGGSGYEQVKGQSQLATQEGYRCRAAVGKGPTVGPTNCAISVPFALALINHRTNGSTYSPGESRKHHAFPGTDYSDSDASKVRKAMIAAANRHQNFDSENAVSQQQCADGPRD